MRVSVRSKRWIGCAAGAAAVALCLTGCGRGPLEQIASPSKASITIQLWVQGQITPSQGNYIIALNADTGASPNFQDINFPATQEPTGEPTVLEAYGLSPPPFTHWDQAVVYGSSPNGLPTCTPPPANRFTYCFKAVSQSGGVVVIKFIPIFLTANTFTFNPNGNGGSGTGNAMILTMPLSCLGIFAGANSLSCDSVASSVTQIYVNFITLDTTGAPQDQLACFAGQSFPIDVTFTNTTQLVKPTNCTSPSNQNLVITGGIVSVNVPGT